MGALLETAGEPATRCVRGDAVPQQQAQHRHPAGFVRFATPEARRVDGREERGAVLVGADGKVLANLLGLDTAAAPVGSEVEVTGITTSGERVTIITNDTWQL